MSTTVGTIAEASGRAVASMFIVLLVGVLFAYFKKIDEPGLKSASVAINYLYVPALLFYSFGLGLTVELLTSGAWMLMIIGLASIPISGLIAYPMMLLAKPPEWFGRLVHKFRFY
jgi:predicted permease